MGGGDLNMKKSWHPVLLVNQERVWKAEKAANEDKKALAQLRKEREEERQLQELQAMQEAATGKKRVNKLDWMYAAPGNEGGALGGQRLGDKDMEDYLLGKKRVDEVLGQGDKNIGNTHRDFIAVQNANTVRDTAAKVREDPLLAIKKQELAAMEAMRNRPDIRKKMMEMQQGKGKESKEERREKRRLEKEERRKERQEIRDRRARRHGDHGGSRDDRSPQSDYSSDNDRRRSSYKRDDRDRYDDRDRRGDRRSSHRDRSRSRSYSPRRSDRERDRRREDDSSRRYRDDERRREDRSSGRGRDERDERHDPRIPPPRQYPSAGTSHSRPSAMDLAERPSYSGQGNGHSNGHYGRNGNGAGYGYGNGNGNNYAQNHHPSRNSQPAPPVDPAQIAAERAAKLAAMSASASALDESRTKSLAQRAEEERAEMEKEERMRKKYTKDDVKGAFFAQKAEMGLSETLGRRNGVGLQRDI